MNRDIGNRDPEQQLLTLNTSKPLHPPILNDRSDLSVIPDAPTDPLEIVSFALLLLQPDESGLLVVADLDYVVEREQTFGEVDFREKLQGFLLADVGAGVDFGVLAVGLGGLCRHGWL